MGRTHSFETNNVYCLQHEIQATDRESQGLAKGPRAGTSTLSRDQDRKQRQAKETCTSCRSNGERKEGSSKANAKARSAHYEETLRQARATVAEAHQRKSPVGYSSCKGRGTHQNEMARSSAG